MGWSIKENTMKKQPHIAIIGAGMTGASAAHCLMAQGVNVSVFDKAKGVGGRMSSKRTAYGSIDFGAQYFTVRDPEFAQQVSDWQQQALVQPWPQHTALFAKQQLHPSPDSQQRYVGTPTMHGPIKTLLRDCTVHVATPIERCEYLQSFDSSTCAGQWQLTTRDKAVHLGFDGLLVTAPWSQSRALVPQLPLHAAKESLQPCWAVLLVLQSPVDCRFDGVFVQQGHLRWVACQSSKPGREAHESQLWMLHFSAEFSAAHLDIELEALQAAACLEFEAIVGTPIKCIDMVAHRWLYASVDETQAAPGLYTESRRNLVLAGDWCLGGRVENAWLAGQQAAHWLLAQPLIKG